MTTNGTNRVYLGYISVGDDIEHLTAKRACVCVCGDAARFQCENSEVSVGERNVCLKCEVRAQPRLTALYWIIDDNGTTVYEGEVVDRYWTLILVRMAQL